MFHRFPVNAQIRAPTFYHSHRASANDDAVKVIKVVKSAKAVSAKFKGKKDVKLNGGDRVKLVRMKKIAVEPQRKELRQHQRDLDIDNVLPNKNTPAGCAYQTWSRRRRNHAMNSAKLLELLQHAYLQEQEDAHGRKSLMDKTQADLQYS